MAESKLTKYEGFLLMAPVFTPYNDSNQIDYELIELYAEHMKTNGISAVLVNGTSGEGMSLNVNERIKLAEKWSEVCKKLDILLMVQVGGCPFADVKILAEHAASVNVDGVLVLPELYFKPKNIERLVQYLKDVSIYCPTVPLYYYHIPMFTQVDLPMASFMELARREIPNFAGIKYTSGDLEKALPCLQYGQVFLGSDTILVGAIALGFNCAIMTTLNIAPEISLKIINHMHNGLLQKARNDQKILNDLITSCLAKGV